MLVSGAIMRMRLGARQFGTKQLQKLKAKIQKSKYATAHADSAATDSNLLVRWQIDSGFWTGTGYLVVLLGVAYLVPTETQAKGMVAAVNSFRSLGVTVKNIPDTALMNDYFRRNILAFYNVMLASPAFYFLWHLVHNAGVVTSAARSITGTVRIAPFLLVLYGGCAVTLPVGTNMLMNYGLEYKDASLKAAAGALFTGMAALEALAELRGCGVTFSQMNGPSVMCFMVALIGRLATGVLVQQQKIGKEFENALPADWKADSGFKGQLYRSFDAGCIDNDFFRTLVGTSVFQHFLNSITYVLLTKGKATKLSDISRYLTGGLNGTPASAFQQFGRTVGLRLGFCGCWNWLSAQRPPEFAAIGLASKMLEEKAKKA